MVEEDLEWGWEKESELKPEAQHWHQWNGHSPELEFCNYAKQLITLLKPMLVLETGTGQGYLTRRTVPVMPDISRYVCFETLPEFVEKMKDHYIFQNGLAEVICGTLDPTLASQADLTIIDSAGGPGRIKEIETWWNAAKPGALALIHDVSQRHPPVTTHYRHYEYVKTLKIPGVFMTNPRGSFLGQKP